MDLCLLSIQLRSLNLRKTLLKNAKENLQERSGSVTGSLRKLRNLNMWSFPEGS